MAKVKISTAGKELSIKPIDKKIKKKDIMIKNPSLEKAKQVLALLASNHI